MYKFNEEEQMILSMVDDLCKDVIAPRAPEIDKSGEFPWDVFKILAEQGIYQLCFEEKYGGAGVGLHCWLKMMEKIAAASCAVSMLVGNTSLGSAPVVLAGSEEQKMKVIPELATGEALIAFALTEPNAGSDVNGIATTAVKKGDKYVINGNKIFITSGSVAKYFCIFAKVVEDGEKKLSCFLAEKDTPGLIIGRDEEKLGLHGSATTQLFFENLELPESALLGKVGDGFKIAFQSLNKGRLNNATQAIGLTQAALEAASVYAKTRVQFGKPISEFQAIQFMIADMEIGIEAARLMLDHSATKYIENAPDLMKYASCTKVFCSDLANKATADAIQIFGGYGYCTEYPVERFFRDAKIFPIFEGSNQIQRMIIAKAVLKEYEVV
ncbi:acyl-CoA dehydrogenase family protein [Selenomonadales bacterium OttesenSCG-928-I06]|nr:acyl-CoA dehydrogenase family protein [Selenomonadales bacterium OttesenSCG-928-I06]